MEQGGYVFKQIWADVGFALDIVQFMNLDLDFKAIVRTVHYAEPRDVPPETVVEQPSHCIVLVVIL
jgi:hypothetical protein